MDRTSTRKITSEGGFMSWINDAVVWIKTSKKGEKYISFKAERDIKAGESISLFKNNKNGVETRPDYRASHNDETEDRYQAAAELATLNVDEIPF